ncbi:MauE/DoxX family redox-associated membrane protein [Parafrankia sp. FMc2]|uniref:MauE/DoxX family redox-associated membrane protein n=1 Tax=Parafrankia sp. FMc2 TaxID=3233196 RepID=UPI0034D3F490
MISETASVRGWTARVLPRLTSTVLRVGLGLVWLVAGALKIDDPDGMVRSVRAFRILPESLVDPVAYAVPFIEIALGVLLIVGLAVRLGAIVSGLLFAVYTAAIISAAARGLRIDCGCFSTGGDLTAEAPTHYTQEIVRDSALLIASALLARWPTGFLAVDQLLTRPTHPSLDDDEDDYLGSTDGTTVEEDDAAAGTAQTGLAAAAGADPDRAGSGTTRAGTVSKRR